MQGPSEDVTVGAAVGARPARSATIDGNEAVARVAYKTNEVCIIYPITPASPMGEHADQWATQGKKNLWGIVPDVTQMQSEGGAAGSVHGSLQTGALTTTFTASQGLLLMIPNMYKIAGELTPTVFHIASRSIAAQALSIFGDHQDVMAARQTGFAMLCSSSVQEAQDFAVISQAATLESRVPFVHFFDGFRTSHEINTIELVEDDQILAMIDQERIHEHRARALNPEHAFIRGTAQNPDTYFQARETVNPYYAATPAIVQASMDRFAKLTGRQYELCEYYGAPDAERIIVTLGSSGNVVAETIDYLERFGENKLGVVKLHLYRPFPVADLVAAIPESCKAIAVLDRTKEPGAGGEPLYKDVVTALAEAYTDGSLACEGLPVVIGGRYGLSSKDFTPAMAKGVFDELAKERPKNHFTVGILDDVTHSSIDYDPAFVVEQPGVFSAMFYGQGGDGTVGSNKNTVQIIGQDSSLHAQAFFYYDSKKAGSQTISHLRFGPHHIEEPYYIQQADFVACHLFSYLAKNDVLEFAKRGATFLINSTYGSDEVWDRLPREVQREIIERELKLYTIDAYKVAGDAGLGRRISTIMQTCFFAISGVLPKDEAIAKIKEKIHKTFHRKGEKIVEMNYAAVDMALANLHRVVVPKKITSAFDMPSPVKPGAPEFVRNVIGPMIAGRGDRLPVSMLPIDGTYPSGTTAWETKDLTLEVPVWEPEICAQCGNCEIVCPHAVIRMKTYDEDALEDAPEAFKSIRLKGRGVDTDQRYTLQIAVDSCTGCGLCVAACPVDSNPAKPGMKAINMAAKAPILEQERASWDFFQALPQRERGDLESMRMRETQLMQPTFEFSGACAGCGETPYLKLLTQLYGDHLYVANATGCSSIFGGNQPTTPWAKDAHGRGPAWSNSLFEDNAEFGYGFRVTLDKLSEYARQTLEALAPQVGEGLAREILTAPQASGTALNAQRARLDRLRERLKTIPDPRAKDLHALADHLLKRVVWIVGGDGWAYDIGFGGLDHVLASDRDVNVLVMDTEVYSNTGGQRSKATPRAATAKFATGGKVVAKKDLGLIAVDYGHVYVGQIAFGADPKQTVRAMQEAVEHKGPSILIAYATCIAHGFDLTYTIEHMRSAVDSGYWPLYRYNPALKRVGRNPMQLDSKEPSITFKEYASSENRYRVLAKTNPGYVDELMDAAQADVTKRWQAVRRLAEGVEA
ncbi:MAG TPA: pyruvate:ferredoxin (flavodoxin) oxidoreductase [Gammaproteobacteria bacterium]|nr:pyruvate:ferredoxin (flavodoxin) oxidoreductase [Gammaproteobacteria bacterium]